MSVSPQVVNQQVCGVGFYLSREFLYRLEHAYDLVHDTDSDSPYDKIRGSLKGLEGFYVVIGNQLFEEQVDVDEDSVIRYPTDLLILSKDNTLDREFDLVISQLKELFEKDYPDNVCDIAALRVGTVSTERMRRLWQDWGELENRTCVLN